MTASAPTQSGAHPPVYCSGRNIGDDGCALGDLLLGRQLEAFKRLIGFDSDERSSRCTGAHWRTRGSEASAQSQDPQSPQPIRGYTGGPELLVGGATRSTQTHGPTTCSPADGRLLGQLLRYKLKHEALQFDDR
ncbi:unnamed protein product [Pleuronectes platessa]|uniref:Uncharacterized protein n=1 Tax=Pleuronectes platessa TaxID=8262 RepID=A0A9N7VXJ8_PLEPL|nr:unnamed protein product [Pleuronectes platessa]